MKNQRKNEKKIKIKTRFGNVSIKIICEDGKIVNYFPEYSECEEISKGFNLPVEIVYKEILNVFKKYLQCWNR